MARTWRGTKTLDIQRLQLSSPTQTVEETLRDLLPQAARGPGMTDADLVEVYSRDIPPTGDRPFTRVNMISSLDGALAVAGRAGGLGGPGDKAVFQVLRSLADVILVGAGTVRIERYGPPSVPPHLQQLRAKRGQAPQPVLAIVSQSGNLDWGSKLFREAERKPIVITPGTTNAHVLLEAREVADVLTTGAGAVDLKAALTALAAEGMRQVLCEGGPTLNASLAAVGLVDELCLTISPQLAGSVGGALLGGWLGSTGVWLSRTGSEGERTFRTQPLSQLLKFNLVHLLEDEGYLFLRLRAVNRVGPA